MTSPVLDEDVMLQLLDPNGPLREDDNAARSGATFLLVDAFDRKVTRDQFIAAVGAASLMYDAAARHTMMANTKDFFVKAGDQLTRLDLELAVKEAQQLVVKGAAECHKLARLLKQCALDEDKIH